MHAILKINPKARARASQAGIVGLLIERVDIQADGVRIRLKPKGLGSLARELLPAAEEQAA